MSAQARLAEIERRLARMAFGRVGSYGDEAIGQLLVDARDLLTALREAERRYESEVKLANSLGHDLEALSDEMDGRLAAAERRAEEAESKLATATDTIRSLTALASEREMS